MNSDALVTNATPRMIRRPSPAPIRACRVAIPAAVLVTLLAGCAAMEDDPRRHETRAISASEGEDIEAAMARFNAERPRLEALQEDLEAELWKNHPGVVSIGIGVGKDGKASFKVGVADKITAGAVPRQLEGVAVEVTVTGTAKLMDGGPTCNGGAGPPCHRDQLPLPVEMGNSGAWFLGTACTMGFKACDRSSGESVMVTASHCAQYANGCALAAVGDPVEHVSPMDQPPGVFGVEIGAIAGHAAPSCGSGSNHVDATKVESAFYETSKYIRDLGNPKAEILDPMPGLRIKYSGRTTGFNSGVLEAVNVSVMVPAAGGFCCGPLLMKDQLKFRVQVPVMGGDSGSALLIANHIPLRVHNRIAGLLFAYDGVYGYANDIGRVMSELDLTLDFTQCGFPEDY